MYGAQEIGEHDHPAFYGMVRRLALQAGLPMPKVYIIPDQSPNAFATGRNPQHAAVAATEGSCAFCRRKNWKGSWPMNWPMSRTATSSSAPLRHFAGAISMIGTMLQWGRHARCGTRRR